MKGCASFGIALFGCRQELRGGNSGLPPPAAPTALVSGTSAAATASAAAAAAAAASSAVDLGGWKRDGLPLPTHGAADATLYLLEIALGIPLGIPLGMGQRDGIAMPAVDSSANAATAAAAGISVPAG
jgi:hypothetical protein